MDREKEVGVRSDASTDPESVRPPHVMLFMSDFGGGTANHVFPMVREWNRNGWSPKLVTEDHRAAEIDLPADISVLPPMKFEWLDRFPVAQTVRLAQLGHLLRRGHPDVLHTYFFWPIMYGRLLKLAGLVPRLVENREDLGFNWGPPQYAMLRATASLPDRVICVSEAIQELAVEKEGLEPSRTEVIHNGIAVPRTPSGDEKERLRRELGLQPHHLVVTMVANYQRPVKGMDHFLAAAPLILEAVPEARLLVVGEGPDRYARRADEMGLGDRLLFVGRRPREEIDCFYALSDVSVLTSLSEGLSITILESMSHGLPVVATRAGGNPEVVVDGVTGFLVAPRDPEAFAERVVTLLRNPGTRKEMGRAARRRAKRDFSAETAAKRYLGLYATLSDDSPPTPELTLAAQPRG